MRHPHRLFVSYARSAREFADRLAQALIAAGHEISADARPGEQWWDHLRGSLGNCDAVVFVATSSSLQSAFVMSEVGAGFAAGKPVIPVIPAHGRLPPGLPAPLRDLDWIRMGNRDIQAVAEEIDQRLSAHPAAASA